MPRLIPHLVVCAIVAILIQYSADPFGDLNQANQEQQRQTDYLNQQNQYWQQQDQINQMQQQLDMQNQQQPDNCNRASAVTICY